MEIKWLDKPKDSSFDAALSYLTLLVPSSMPSLHQREHTEAGPEPLAAMLRECEGN